VAMEVLHSNHQVLAMIARRWPTARTGHGADFATVQVRLPDPVPQTGVLRYGRPVNACHRRQSSADTHASCGGLYSMSMAGEVSPPGRGDEVVSPDGMRASHEDRDRVVEVLRVAAGDGRLTAEELDERIELAMTARTYGELARLVSDLPAEGAVVSPAVASPAPRAKEVARIDIRSGHVQRIDRWVVPQRMDVKVTSGHVKLDFTQAVITQPSLKLDIDVRSGYVTLVTKPGIVVDADDVAIRSGHVKVRAPWGSEAPVQLRIEVTGKVGSGHFRAGPRSRTFWEWLTRKPRPFAIAPR